MMRRCCCPLMSPLTSTRRCSSSSLPFPVPSGGAGGRRGLGVLQGTGCAMVRFLSATSPLRGPGNLLEAQRALLWASASCFCWSAGPSSAFRSSSARPRCRGCSPVPEPLLPPPRTWRSFSRTTTLRAVLALGFRGFRRRSHLGRLLEPSDRALECLDNLLVLFGHRVLFRDGLDLVPQLGDRLIDRVGRDRCRMIVGGDPDNDLSVDVVFDRGDDLADEFRGFRGNNDRIRRTASTSTSVLTMMRTSFFSSDFWAQVAFTGRSRTASASEPKVPPMPTKRGVAPFMIMVNLFRRWWTLPKPLASSGSESSEWLRKSSVSSNVSA